MTPLRRLQTAVVMCAFASTGSGATFDQSQRQFGKLPLRFEANRGQAHATAKFLCRGVGYTLALTATDAVLSADGTVRMRPLGANTDAPVEGLETLPGITNYIKGNDPQGWHTGIRGYARVRYRGIYPGIDLIYYGNGQQIEYDFVVAPQANPSSIRLVFEGAESIAINAHGDLVLGTRTGDLIHRKPVVWEEVRGRKRQIGGRYVLHGQEIGFDLDAYDTAATLVIDPVLVYATYLGGPGSDHVRALAVDAEGNAYVAGYTALGGFPITPGALQQNRAGGQSEIFVAKLNSTGTALIYATYLGGAGEDQVSAIAVDLQGNAYVTGSTDSSNFPITTGAYQTTPGGKTSAFVSKLNATGSALVYSTYLGRQTQDLTAFTSASDLAVDSNGSAYVTGAQSCPSDFPVTAGAFRAPGWCSQFVAKLNASGTALEFSTDFGGTHIALDLEGNVFLAGYVGDIFSESSSMFPTTPGALKPACRLADYGNTSDSFIAKLDRTGRTLVFSTCFPGDISGIAVDAAGNVVIAGTTITADFPLTPGVFRSSGNPDCDANKYANAFSPSGSGCEVFVTQLDSRGRLVYSTYVFGTVPNSPISVAIDAAGNVYLAGPVYRTDHFPSSPGAAQLPPVSPFFSGFLIKLNASVSGLIESARIRTGSHALQLAVDNRGSAYVAGWAFQDDVPVTSGVIQPRFADGGSDGVVARFGLREAAVLPSFDAAGIVNAASYRGGPVAPGEVVTIFGTSFGPPVLTSLARNTSGRVSSELGWVRVLFDGVPAPMIYATENQVSAIVPFSVAGKMSTAVQVEYLGNRSAPVVAPVAAASPAIFTLDASGRGPGAILNSGFTVNTPANPARIGSYIAIYVTGAGPTNPGGVDGEIGGAALSSVVLTATAKIGGVTAEVLSATTAPGLVSGVIQVNVGIPGGVGAGVALPVEVGFGMFASQPGVTVAVR